MASILLVRKRSRLQTSIFKGREEVVVREECSKKLKKRQMRREGAEVAVRGSIRSTQTSTATRVGHKRNLTNMKVCLQQGANGPSDRVSYAHGVKDWVMRASILPISGKP